MKIHNHDTELEELLDCPFCGARPVAYLKGNTYLNLKRKKVSIIVKCTGCYVQREIATLGGHNIEWLEDISIAKWNARLIK
jgi:transcription elongation factor Elf1